MNVRTGKPSLAQGYSPRTINHALTVISGFYDFHARFGRGPVANPVPASAARRALLGHRSSLEGQMQFRRARLRQRVVDQVPRALSDAHWDELFAALRCDRDRALMLCYVTSGARASELLGLRVEDIDWARQVIYVVSKGTRLRQAIPASPAAFRMLARYFEADGAPATGEPVWRTRRGEIRPLTYSAVRRVLQRVNEVLGTNWTLHDLRHTAATRLANDPQLTLTEVQAILRHAAVDTTGRYLRVRVEDMFDQLQEHYQRERPAPSFPAGYDTADVLTVFGG